MVSVRHRLLFLLFCLSLFNLTPVVAADFKTAPRIILELGGHTGRIWDLMFTPDGRQLVTVSYDKSIRVWDVASGKSIRVLRPPSGFGNEGRLVTAALSADGKLIATAGVGVSGSKNAVYLISMKTGEIEAVLLGHTKPINHVAFSPDGKSLVSAGHDQTARLWDLTTRKTLKTFEGHSAFINMVSFSADSKYLATASGDANTIVWNLSTGKKELTLKHGGNCVDASFSIDNKMIATADNSGLSLWSMKGERLGLVKVPQLSAIQFTHASTKVMFAGGLGFVDVKSGAIQRMSADVMTGVAVSPDGQQIATGTPSGEVILWDITRNRRLRPASRPVKRVGWSADGKKIFWTHEGRESSLKKSFSLTKLEFAASLAPKEIEAVKDGPIISQNGITLKIRNDRLAVEVFKGKKKHRNLVVPYFGTGFETISCFTVVKEGQAAIGNNNGEIFLFNIDTGKLVRKLRGHIGEIWSLVPSPDGRYLLSGANDHTLRIWQLDRQDPLMSFCEADGEWVAWTPEGFYASSVGGERMITWQVDQGPKKMAKLYYASQFHDTFFQPDVMAKLLVTGNVEEAVKASATIGVLNNQFYDLRDAELFEQFAPPEVKLVEPAESGTIKTKLLKLRASVRLVNKSPLRDVIILVNGRPQKPETLVQSPDDPRQWNVESEIELVAGRNQIAVLATTDVAAAISLPVQIFFVPEDLDDRGVTPIDPAPPSQINDLYILSVGISDYVDKSIKLNYAHRDAEEFTKRWQREAKGLYKDVHSRTLINEDAERGAILDGIDWIVENAKRQDVVLLHLSAHGFRDDAKNYYLSTHEVDRKRLRSTAIRWSQIVDAISDMRADKVVVFVDTCHSGGITGAKALEKDPIRDLAGVQVGAIVLSSSSLDRPSYEDKLWGHGAFTKALLDTMSDHASDISNPPDGRLSVLELGISVKNRVRELTNHRQIPIIQKPFTIPDFDIAKILSP